MLLRAGDSELFTGQPLTTAECLEFLTSLDRGPIYVGFAFGYDVTMILRDLSEERRAHLLKRDKAQGAGFSRYTFWRSWGIEYLPRQYLRICKIKNGKAVPDTSITIWETFGFFQCSFLKALKNFGVGTDYLEFIESNKSARERFTEITPEIRHYCKLECEFLAQLMTQLRDNCEVAEIRPSTWNGAGKLATALHRKHETPTRAELDTIIPEPVRMMARAAYYGGRFEVTRIGAINQTVWEYDIRSAYPDAMRKLPCLTHGKWERINNAREYERLRQQSNELFIASVRFAHEAKGRRAPMGGLHGLPIRSAKGQIFWPSQGNGVYWSAEIQSARLLGCHDTFRGGFRYIGNCDCQPFNWVEPLYDYRRQIGSKGPGYPIKLGLNSLYGKLAQRIGSPRYGNFVWAGLITALTRAKLNSAAALAPGQIVMLATDALYSLAPLDLPQSERLGDWEGAEHPRMFIVQPGLYWGPPKPKTRGIPPKFFETRTQAFERAWAGWAELACAAVRTAGLGFPAVKVPVTQFIGLKLAQARGKPLTAGQWAESEREISFDWRVKRGPGDWVDGHVVTRPLPGSRELETVLHGTVETEIIAQLELLRAEFDECPDYVDLGIPWKE